MSELIQIGLETVIPLISQEEVQILDNLVLITYNVSIILNNQGQGFIPLDIAWERVVSVIPTATRNEDGNWVTCTASLAEADGQTLADEQTLLVVTKGTPKTTVTVFVKVLEDLLKNP